MRGADVTQQAIANCFQKAGFLTTLCADGSTSDALVNSDSDNKFDEDDDLPHLHCCRKQTSPWSSTHPPMMMLKHDIPTSVILVHSSDETG